MKTVLYLEQSGIMEPGKHTVDVSVIIVNWNTQALLLQCIESLKQTALGFTMEIIVVDNASADGSQEAVQRQHPDVLLICNTENLGFAKANNIGIARCSGRYICLINSDIKVLGDCMGLLFRYLEQNPSVGMVGPLTVNEDLTPRFNCRKIPTLWNCFVENMHLHKLLPMFTAFQGRALPPATYEATHEAECLSGCFMIVRREAVDQAGLLDERFFFYSEDVDWCKRFSAAGWKIVFYSESKAIHYGGGSTDAAPVKYLIQMEKANYQYWQKHHCLASLTVYRLLKITNYAISILAISVIALFFSKKTWRAKNKIQGYHARLLWLIKPYNTA